MDWGYNGRAGINFGSDSETLLEDSFSFRVAGEPIGSHYNQQNLASIENNSCNDECHGMFEVD